MSLTQNSKLEIQNYVWSFMHSSLDSKFSALGGSAFGGKILISKLWLLLPLILLLGYSYSAKAAIISKPPSNLGLVGYWSFNDATSTNTSFPTRATDFSGNNNTGS